MSDYRKNIIAKKIQHIDIPASTTPEQSLFKTLVQINKEFFMLKDTKQIKIIKAILPITVILISSKIDPHILHKIEIIAKLVELYLEIRYPTDGN